MSGKTPCLAATPSPLARQLAPLRAKPERQRLRRAFCRTSIAGVLQRTFRELFSVGWTRARTRVHARSLFFKYLSLVRVHRVDLFDGLPRDSSPPRVPILRAWVHVVDLFDRSTLWTCFSSQVWITLTARPEPQCRRGLRAICRRPPRAICRGPRRARGRSWSRRTR